MALKYEIESLEELDSNFHNLYAKVGEKFVLDIDGVKPLSEFNNVYSALQKERNDTKIAKQKLAAFGDLNAETVVAQLARITELEELSKGTHFDDAKLEEMSNARANAKIQPYKTENEMLTKRVTDSEQRVMHFETVERQRRMADEFISKIKAAKIDPRFEETVMMKAERLFVETEEGKFLTREGLTGVVGYLPFEVWLGEQQAINPHYWGDSLGGGAKGSGSAMYAGNNPFIGGITGNVTEQMRIERENPALASQLQKAAAMQGKK